MWLITQSACHVPHKLVFEIAHIGEMHRGRVQALQMLAFLSVDFAGKNHLP
jgi:hypothetical protein